MRISIIPSLILLALFFSSCAPFKPTDDRAAICNELNSKLIFNGSTSDARQVDIQHSEEPLLWRSYEKNNCDQR